MSNDWTNWHEEAEHQAGIKECSAREESRQRVAHCMGEARAIFLRPQEAGESRDKKQP